MTILVNGRHVTWDEFLASAETATDVRLYNLPMVTAVPELPVATVVKLDNLPMVTAVPELPVATVVWLYNLPMVTAVPELPVATVVWLDNHLKSLKKPKPAPQKPKNEARRL